MKGNKEVIDALNDALKLELGAVNQYWLHYRRLDDWGFTKLAKKERAGIDRGDAARRQADHAHHLPRGLPEDAGDRAADDRREPQGGVSSAI